MSTNQPARTARGHEGLSVAIALRHVLRCGVILIDGRAHTAKVSEEASQILCLKPEPTARPGLEMLPAPLASLVREAASTRTPVANRPMDLRAAGRPTPTLQASISFIEPGKPDSDLVLVLNDLTPTEPLNQSLGRIDRLALLGTLSAGMAHEIKNALVAGKTFVDLLLERHQDAELVEVVRRELARIDTIVSRMLKFAGPGSPTFTEIRLHEVLDYSLRLVQPQLVSKDISLTRSFHAQTDRVSGDDSQLQQAFVNLLLNALEAVGIDGTLTVATELISPETGSHLPAASPARFLRITIHDDGAGVAPENLDRLFEPFFTTKPNGTGLGLPITRQIIEEHRGNITVTSEPGKGTAFQIILPALMIAD